MTRRSLTLLASGLVGGAIFVAGCNTPGSDAGPASDGSAATRTFVPPGSLDEYYLF